MGRAGGGHSYGTDITRTWPPSGRFSALQRTVYSIVLEAQRAALALFQEGKLATGIGGLDV
jgi:Xaa-Pro aminopeptidase